MIRLKNNKIRRYYENHQRIAYFEKVSFEQFLKDVKIPETDKLDIENVGYKMLVRDIYNNIVKPRRSTSGSAGYDFVSPFSFVLNPGETIKIATGIRVAMDENWCLKIYPRSGLGTKYRLQLDNTVGIIDSDYYFSDNEGHIMLNLTNDSKTETLTIKAGDRIVQGIFCEYGITVDDNVINKRNGGYGSTGR